MVSEEKLLEDLALFDPIWPRPSAPRGGQILFKDKLFSPPLGDHCDQFHQNQTSGFRGEVYYVNCLHTTHDERRRTKVDRNRSTEVFR